MCSTGTICIASKIHYPILKVLVAVLVFVLQQYLVHQFIFNALSIELKVVRRYRPSNSIFITGTPDTAFFFSFCVGRNCLHESLKLILLATTVANMCWSLTPHVQTFLGMLSHGYFVTRTEGDVDGFCVSKKCVSKSITFSK